MRRHGLETSAHVAACSSFPGIHAAHQLMQVGSTCIPHAVCIRGLTHQGLRFRCVKLSTLPYSPMCVIVCAMLLALQNFQVFGYARSKMTDTEFRDLISK